jgi:hypothetical protein
MINLYDLVGLAEIRDMFGLDQQTPHTWRQRGVLPPQLPHKVSSRPMWLRQDILDWATRTGRKVINPTAGLEEVA